MMLGTIVRTYYEAFEIMGFVIGLDEPFSYKPSQYVLLNFSDDPAIKRFFSIVSYDPELKELNLLIKQVGEFTTRLFDSPVGTELNVMGPYGKFFSEDSDKPIVLVAGGIGITPIYSILMQLIHSERKSSIYLFYSAKSKGEMALFDEIRGIKDDRFHVILCFTRDIIDGCLNRRIDGDVIKDYVPQLAACEFYMCGRKEMMSDLKTQLMQRGVSDENIFTEGFG
jgi:ferredoxin-NADP reductase